MIDDFDTDTITKTARIGFLLACPERIKHHFTHHPGTRESIEKLTREVWSWLSQRQPSCSVIYRGNNPVLMEQELLYHGDPVLLRAFHAVLYMHLYTMHKMHAIEYFESGGVEPAVGSDVFEVDEDYFFKCVNSCIDLSQEPAATQVWVENTMVRLHQGHRPAKDDDHGQPVSMKDFQT